MALIAMRPETPRVRHGALTPMIWQSLSPGTSTGRHIHQEVDEFFGT